MTGKKPSPYKTGFACRCPSCGEGKLFRRYLKVAEACQACQASFEEADPGDGPAIFIMFIVGFIVVFAALYVEVVFKPSYWIHALLWFPLAAILSLVLLPLIKSLLISLQFTHDAKESKFSAGDQQDGET